MFQISLEENQTSIQGRLLQGKISGPSALELEPALKDRENAARKTRPD